MPQKIDPDVILQAEAWQIDYLDYLKSPSWQATRRIVLERDNGICQGCLEAPASEVHHLDYRTYNGTGRTLAFECVSLCRACHEAVHWDKQHAP